MSGCNATTFSEQLTKTHEPRQAQITSGTEKLRRRESRCECEKKFRRGVVGAYLGVKSTVVGHLTVIGLILEINEKKKYQCSYSLYFLASDVINISPLIIYCDYIYKNK